MGQNKDNLGIPIMKSCYYKKTLRGENMITSHAFAYQISGSLTVRDGNETVVFQPGDFRLNVRNQLAKFIKQPGEDEPFQSLSISFDEEILREVAHLYNYSSEKKVITKPSIPLKSHPLYLSFIESLQPYLPFSSEDNDQLVKLKLKEALLILLKVQPELKDILFNFDFPEKINLEAFMNQNYKYNMNIERFAYLSGRSLSAFKRDFKQIFNDTPNHWLVKKRLQEAHFLIENEHQKPSDFYIELGFEDLSHFYFVFKKQFGYAPSSLR